MVGASVRHAAGFEFDECDALAAVPAARVPTLLVHGTHDDFILPKHSQQLHDAMVDAATERVGAVAAAAAAGAAPAVGAEFGRHNERAAAAAAAAAAATARAAPVNVDEMIEVGARDGVSRQDMVDDPRRCNGRAHGMAEATRALVRLEVRCAAMVCASRCARVVRGTG